MEHIPNRRHILIAVDESPASRKAFDWALSDLYREGDMVYLFHVIPTGQHVILSSDVGTTEVVQDPPAALQQTEDHGREFLAKTFTPKLEELKIPYELEMVRFNTDADSIGSIICKRANQLDACAVVMAKHNKGAIKEFFMGSVSNYMVHNCKSPVCILHVD